MSGPRGDRIVDFPLHAAIVEPGASEKLAAVVHLIFRQTVIFNFAVINHRHGKVDPSQNRRAPAPACDPQTVQCAAPAGRADCAGRPLAGIFGRWRRWPVAPAACRTWRAGCKACREAFQSSVNTRRSPPSIPLLAAATASVNRFWSATLISLYRPYWPRREIVW